MAHRPPADLTDLADADAAISTTLRRVAAQPTTRTLTTVRRATSDSISQRSPSTAVRALPTTSNVRQVTAASVQPVSSGATAPIDAQDAAQTSAATASSSTGVIVGVIVGVVALLLISIGIYITWKKRKAVRKEQTRLLAFDKQDSSWEGGSYKHSPSSFSSFGENEKTGAMEIESFAWRTESPYAAFSPAPQTGSTFSINQPSRPSSPLTASRFNTNEQLQPMIYNDHLVANAQPWNGQHTFNHMPPIERVAYPPSAYTFKPLSTVEPVPVTAKAITPQEPETKTVEAVPKIVPQAPSPIPNTYSGVDFDAYGRFSHIEKDGSAPPSGSPSHAYMMLQEPQSEELVESRPMSKESRLSDSQFKAFPSPPALTRQDSSIARPISHLSSELDYSSVKEQFTPSKELEADNQDTTSFPQTPTTAAPSAGGHSNESPLRSATFTIPALPTPDLSRHNSEAKTIPRKSVTPSLPPLEKQRNSTDWNFLDEMLGKATNQCIQ